MILTALKLGKPVVTANKALLSKHGEELFAAAKQFGLVKESGAAQHAVLTAEQYQMIAVGIRQVEQVARIAAIGDRMTAGDEAMR